MFLQMSVCPQGGGGVHGCRGHAWLPGGHAWLVGGSVVAGWGHAWLPGGVHRIPRDTVNERAVRILLECILVQTSHYLITSSVTSGNWRLTKSQSVFHDTGHMKLCFTNSFTASGRILPKLYSRVHHPQHFNFIVHEYIIQHIFIHTQAV